MIIDIVGGQGQNAESRELVRNVNKFYTKKIDLTLDNAMNFTVEDDNFKDKTHFFITFTNWGGTVKCVSHAVDSSTITVNLQNAVNGYVNCGILAVKM